jgi:intraflagellar transport protein 140
MCTRAHRCAEAFLAAGRHEQAVRLLAKACQHERAVELLVVRGVPLSDDLADALTSEKLPDNADSRAGVLLRIAQVRASALMCQLASCALSCFPRPPQAAKAQGLFHLACKKFTQAGDRLRAARALIRSGDTAKVVVYAGVSRQREVYIMAANYLQSLNWRGAPELLNHILAFYTKAGAADCLANFYLSCAATELGEFKAYDKALQVCVVCVCVGGGGLSCHHQLPATSPVLSG